MKLTVNLWLTQAVIEWKNIDYAADTISVLRANGFWHLMQRNKKNEKHAIVLSDLFSIPDLLLSRFYYIFAL